MILIRSWRGKISVLGLEANGLAENSNTKEIQSTYEMAIERGINFFDLAGANAEPFVPLGKAIKGKRDKVYLQVHFGADYSDYKYGWTMDTKKIVKVVEQQFKALDTDYADFGFIQCIDQIAELESRKRRYTAITAPRARRGLISGW